MSNNLNYYINAIQSMGLQAIKEAKQGHPGMTLSAACINFCIYTNFINLSRVDPNWINRDRFVLSAGHGSMSLYPILCFSGVLNIDEIKKFRQKNSLTPGHPESYLTPYIDATTGPLGQGVGMGVGMAIAEQYLNYQYKKLKGLIDHYTYIVIGDGDLQEGVSYESMSLAGKLKLSKLIVLYDSNKYQLESSVKTVNIENIKKRFESMNWYYQKVENNFSSICDAINNAKKQNSKPSIIEVNTIIGEGLSFANNADAHGGSINQQEIDNFNKHFNCNFNNWNFSSDIYKYFKKNVFDRGNEKYQKWLQLIDQYKVKYPKLTKKFLNQINNNFVNVINNKIDVKQNMSGRNIFGSFMNIMNNEKINDTIILSPDISKSTSIKFSNNYYNFNKKNSTILVGIREFGMASIQNGICLHKGLRCFSSSFLSFVDYFKSAIRLGAISQINPVYFLTHDSVLIGSDGPTHQPIEQIGMLRSICNHNVYRPCDEKESIGCFMHCSQFSKTSSSFILSRQNLKSNFNTNIEKTIKYGGYPILNSNSFDYAILATGSEVELAINVANKIKELANINITVYSIPNLNLFLNKYDLDEMKKYKYGLYALEASNDNIWYRFAKYNKLIVHGINKYGYSMDGLQLYSDLGYNIDYITKQILKEIVD